MKDKKETSRAIRIIIYILYALAIFFVCYKAYSLVFKNNGGNENKPESVPAEAIDKETYEKLISYIPYYPFTTGIYKDAYNGTKVTKTDIGDTLIATSIFGRYEESYTAKNGNTQEVVNLLKANNLSEKEVVYYKSDINNFLMKRYNVDLSMLNKLSSKITNLNDEYLTVNINSTFLPQRNKLTINYVATKQEEDVIILEKTIFYEMNTSDKKYYIYENSNINNSQSPLKTYNLIDDTGSTININDVINNDFANYKKMFKHTFKKNDTGYYWYSTELTS